MKYLHISTLLIFVISLSASERRDKYSFYQNQPAFKAAPAAKIGDNPFPTNPLNDRAKGYLLQGKIKNAVTKKCLNGNRAQLITFSSSEGMAEATFKCW